MKTVMMPIEPLEERYSNQWREWFDKYWESVHFSCNGMCLDNKIKVGNFLDVFGTNHWKATQMAELVKHLEQKDFGDNSTDWVFFHDLWSPEVLTLAYIRDGADLPFKIAGCLHAGTWDKHDFLSKKNMTFWARQMESSILKVADLIFVATNFHKNMIVREMAEMTGRLTLEDKLRVTGFPIYADFSYREEPATRLPFVVFPHRLNEEKGPDLFAELAMRMADTSYKFFRTKNICSTKDEYYRLLGDAEFAVSFAEQETWGIAMQEALFGGCIPIVPDRLSYREMYPEDFRYGGTGMEQVAMVEQILRSCMTDRKKQAEMTQKAQECSTVLAGLGQGAIPKMEEAMRSYEHRDLF